MNSISAHMEEAKNAINHQMICIFQLNNQIRVVLPYMLGDTRDGRVVLHGFQFNNELPLEDIEGQRTTGRWGYFYLDQLQSGISSMPSSFRAAHLKALREFEGFYHPPKMVTQVFAQIKEE